METESLGQPCRNFQILGIGSFIDPVDGREKVVLSNFAAGATGDTPGRVNSMAVTAAGVIYLAVGTELVRWAI
ncbi:MAG: hypothetical protein CME05_03830 [Gemmatimonadaceae bacterium]|nr:hypothetical protein [Gemmatimonadaceae bacterium]|tara:strand:- start:549 stop:767 length:219 start_codon:yes stop_codon:yes gene_type:complete